jgi:type III pantothenate kinase
LDLQRNFELLTPPSRIIISNVGGYAMAQRLLSVCTLWPVQAEFVVARTEQCGVRNSYENPSRLGSDRWAALIAAWKRFGRACLVVNCGTATTVDALSNAGEFLGGLIMPGITLMQQSLKQNTAQLQDEVGQLHNFPRNTSDAIYTGVIQATLGAIENQRVLLKKLGTNEIVTCFLSGGAADKIEAHLGMPTERVDNLVLEGLKSIGEASA